MGDEQHGDFVPPPSAQADIARAAEARQRRVESARQAGAEAARRRSTGQQPEPEGWLKEELKLDADDDGADL